MILSGSNLGLSLAAYQLRREITQFLLREDPTAPGHSCSSASTAARRAIGTGAAAGEGRPA